MFSNCEFCLENFAFLVHVISKYGISVDPAKIEAFLKRKRPKSVTRIRSPLGLARIIGDLSKDFFLLPCHLQRLTLKNVKFIWTKACQKLFMS